MRTLNLLFEDGEALVIDKPAGLAVEAPRAGGPSLADYSDWLRLGFQRAPVAVHRLDRDTSGCLLLARNPGALKRFSAAFEARLVQKRYLGIVAGPLVGEAGEITLSLAKTSSAAAGWRMIPAKKGKPARTRWRKLAEVGGHTLVEFHPETGRTHQIRVHAATPAEKGGLGAALLGDPVYGDGTRAARTMLHAAGLHVPRALAGAGAGAGGKPPILAFSPLPADFRALGFAEPGDAAWSDKAWSDSGDAETTASAAEA